MLGSCTAGIPETSPKDKSTMTPTLNPPSKTNTGPSAEGPSSSNQEPISSTSNAPVEQLNLDVNYAESEEESKDTASPVQKAVYK